MPFEENNYVPLIKSKDEIRQLFADLRKKDVYGQVAGLSECIENILRESIYCVDHPALEDEGKGLVALITLLSHSYQTAKRKWKKLTEDCEEIGEEFSTESHEIVEMLNGIAFRSMNRLFDALRPVIKWEAQNHE